jgi:5-methylcytosine-specific restriction endonuclease McrA
MYGALRRARKQTGAIPFTIEELEGKFTYWNNCCWVCGDPADEVDHVKPLAVGGKHMLCNLRPICISCNRRKHGRWPLPSRAEILGFAA